MRRRSLRRCAATRPQSDHDPTAGTHIAPAADPPGPARYVPHHELAQAAGDVEGRAIYHGFTVGRVRFLVLDLRSESEDPEDKASWASYGDHPSMLGAVQCGAGLIHRP